MKLPKHILSKIKILRQNIEIHFHKVWYDFHFVHLQTATLYKIHSISFDEIFRRILKYICLKRKCIKVEFIKCMIKRVKIFEYFLM